MAKKNQTISYEEPTILSEGTEMLPVKLTQEDLLAAGERVAELHSEMSAHEALAKQTKDALKAEESRLLSEMARTAGLLRAKQEIRVVATRTLADFAAGVAITERLDGDDPVELRRRPLTANERQPKLLPVGDSEA